MKKLNRKGFTLIELLAVIVILAVVMVVTIPSILNSMDKARETQLENAANSVAEWFQKNYELADLGAAFGGGASDVYTSFVGTTGLTTRTLNLTNDVLKAAGISGGDDDVTGTVKLNGTQVCVTLSATSTGKFKNVSGSKSSGGC